MSTPPSAPTVSRTYTEPFYVRVFVIAGWSGIITGVIALMLALYGEQPVWAAVSILVGGATQFFFALIADALGRTAWRVELTAQDLAPALAQLAAMRVQAASNGLAVPMQPITDRAEFQRVLETAEHYHLTVAGRERGPFSVAQVREMYARGTVVLSQPTRLEDGEPGPTVGRLIELE